jgi:hypothetical protein
LNATLWLTTGNEQLESGFLTQKPSDDPEEFFQGLYNLSGLDPSDRSVSLRVNVTNVPELIKVFIGLSASGQTDDSTFAVEIKQMKNVESFSLKDLSTPQPIASDVLNGRRPEYYETTFIMRTAVSDAGNITLALTDFENGRSDELYELGTYAQADGYNYVGFFLLNGVTGGRINVDSFSTPTCEGTGEYMALQKYARLALAKESHQF